MTGRGLACWAVVAGVVPSVVAGVVPSVVVVPSVGVVPSVVGGVGVAAAVAA